MEQGELGLAGGARAGRVGRAADGWMLWAQAARVGTA